MPQDNGLPRDKTASMAVRKKGQKNTALYLKQHPLTWKNSTSLVCMLQHSTWLPRHPWLHEGKLVRGSDLSERVGWDFWFSSSAVEFSDRRQAVCPSGGRPVITNSTHRIKSTSTQSAIQIQNKYKYKNDILCWMERQHQLLKCLMFWRKRRWERLKLYLNAVYIGLVKEGDKKGG